MNLFSQLSGVIDAVKAGDIKQAVCNSGALFQTIACDKLAATAPAADAPAPVVPTEQEVCDKLKYHCEELKRAAYQSDHAVKTGTASDTALPPGTWATLAESIFKIIGLFFPKLAI